MHLFFLRVSQAMAILGGGVLLGVIAMVCASIAGRTLNAFLNGDMMQTLAPGVSEALLATGIGPINGDYEILEAAIAFVVFAWLPFCQITNGHASVDLVVRHFPRLVRQVLGGLADIAFAVVLVMIAWQLREGMESKMRSGQTTFLLQFPVWWAYGLSLVAAAIAALVAVYVAVARIFEMVADRTIITGVSGADH
ncbi:TRAP transporter small permease [Oceaniglobus indicus]|uniref:TRAP transporter small permease n=1 Tax=Oceaniglobus indicus TaxID=2047749 RepID=UPI000C19C0FE|nr:TRAP transporter small permease [Oceaniglobus indicus]